MSNETLLEVLALEHCCIYAFLKEHKINGVDHLSILHAQLTALHLGVSTRVLYKWNRATRDKKHRPCSKCISPAGSSSPSP